MVCPNCHHRNSVDARSCTECGAGLSDPEFAPVDEPPNGDSHDRDLRLIQDELASLRDQHSEMDRQLRLVTAWLARVQSDRSTRAQPAGAEPDAISVNPAVRQVRQRRAPPGPPLVNDLSTTARQWNWELILGGNWLARVGVIALIFGVAFFLKLAIDSGWLGPVARVVVGVVIGSALVAAGEFWRSRYRVFAQALSGGGIGILYVSLFAAHSLLGLIDIYLANLVMLLISVTSVALALRYRAISLAVIGILAAFSAPFVLQVFTDRPDDSPVLSSIGLDLLTYIFVVNIGALTLSMYRNWRWMTVLAWIGSMASFVGWYNYYGYDAGVLVAQVSLTLIFLSFVGTTAFFHIILRRPSNYLDQARLLVNALIYFVISYEIMSEDFGTWMGGFALLMALFYGMLTHLNLRRCPLNPRLSLVTFGVALFFFTLASVLQFGDSAWTTVAWAVQGVLLVWASFRLRISHLQVFGYVLFGLVTLRLFAFDTGIALDTYRPVLNERALAFVSSIAALYLTAYLFWRNREPLVQWQRPVSSVFLAAANLCTLWVLGTEIISGFDRQIAQLGSDELRRGVDDVLLNAQNLAVTALLAVYAAAVLAAGIVGRWRMARLAALGLMAVSIGKVFAYDVFTLETVYRIVAFVGLGIILVVGGYAYQRFGRSVVGFLVEEGSERAEPTREATHGRS